MSELGQMFVTTPPAEEPITLAEAKLHLRVDHDDDDTLISSLITAARQYVELSTRRALVTQTHQYVLEEFPCDHDIDLARPPIQSVSSIQYVDTNGDTQTFSTNNWRFIPGEPGEIELKYGRVWPVTQPRGDAVTITYITGYGDASDVPELAKAAIKLYLGHLYENREAVVVGAIVAKVPMAVESIIGMLRWGDYR